MSNAKQLFRSLSSHQFTSRLFITKNLINKKEDIFILCRYFLIGLIIKTGTARIINVSSIAHTFPRQLDLTDLNFERSGPASPDLFLSIYGVTKLCNVLFIKELANRLNHLGKS